MEEQLFEQRTDLSGLQSAVENLKNEIGKVIVGQEAMIELLLAGLLADGHVLIEGVPGVAKTLTAKLMARALSTGFSRIQFTPDLMPSDVTGTSVFNPKETNFQFRTPPRSRKNTGGSFRSHGGKASDRGRYHVPPRASVYGGSHTKPN
jgi:MoxR-like ATPase